MASNCCTVSISGLGHDGRMTAESGDGRASDPIEEQTKMRVDSCAFSGYVDVAHPCAEV